MEHHFCAHPFFVFDSVTTCNFFNLVVMTPCLSITARFIGSGYLADMLNAYFYLSLFQTITLLVIITNELMTHSYLIPS